MMTDEEIVRMMHAHFEGLFPKSCGGCGRRYASLRDYIDHTQRTDPTISYDAELRDWKPTQPLGAVAAVNCVCGTTLALSTSGMPLPQIHAVLEWIKAGMVQRQQSPEEMIEWVRNEVRRLALNGPGMHGNGRPEA